MTSGDSSIAPKTRSCIAWLAVTAVPLFAACAGPGTSQEQNPATMPSDTPVLHHAGLNSTDPDAAIGWYLDLWPSAT